MVEKCATPGHALQCFLYPVEEGMNLSSFTHVKTSKINAELKGSIFLSHQYHCIAPGRLARSDSTSLQAYLLVMHEPLLAKVGVCT